MRLTVRCPAKVNLFLAVGPVDSRGFHPLRTLFQAVGLFDELVLSDEDESGFVCSDPEIPAENTVTKAMRLVHEFAMVPPLAITLHKRIPSQSGLGGGSSDAAGFLRAIDVFLPAPLSAMQKQDVARAVGADVPFFLVGGRARAEGYGEILTPLPDPSPQWLVIVKPPFGTSTAEAYRLLDAQAYVWRDFPESDELYNDFERVAPCLIGDATERLMVHGARDAVLSGSGSAFFGRFDHESAARNAADNMQTEFPGYQIWSVPTLTRAESLTPPNPD